jgi:hypothetical protein
LTDIFVFGSNLSGVHGKGAARDAYLSHGARYYQAQGLQGRSYAIPTRGKWIPESRTFHDLSFEKVKRYIAEFVMFAHINPHLRFNMTRVGCGNAGFTDTQIAPLFKDAPSNVVLPKEWETHAGR